MPEAVQLLNVHQVAKRLYASAGTVLLLVQEGRFPSPISSKPRRWLLSDVVRFLQQIRQYRTCHDVTMNELPDRRKLTWLAEWAPILESYERQLQDSL
jgi:predicted DNA-binding transcriptional regulator AlpA